MKGADKVKQERVVRWCEECPRIESIKPGFRRCSVFRDPAYQWRNGRYCEGRIAAEEGRDAD